MKELINLQLAEMAGNQIHAVDARELHTFLEVGRDFSTWVKDRVEQYGFVENIDYIKFDSPKPGNQKQRGGDRRRQEYTLSIDMAKELSMVENNEQGRIARRYFIDCEKCLIAIAPEQHQISVNGWRKARIETRDYQKIMAAALNLSRARQGKYTKATHYTNEANMLYGVLLGTTAKKWMTSKGLTGELRKYLTAAQLVNLAYLERTNVALIELDMSYQQRKEKLTELLNRHLLEMAS